MRQQRPFFCSLLLMDDRPLPLIEIDMNDICSDSIANLRWLRRAVASCETPEDFDQVEVDFLCDVFEGEEWTTDPARVANFKDLLRRYRRELQERQGD